MKFLTTKYTNIESSEALKNYVFEKIAPLEKYLKRAGTPHDVRIELAKTTRHHKGGPYFRAESNINIPHKMFRAEATAKDIYAAIDGLKEEIERQLVEHFDRLEILSRQGGQEG